MDHNNPFFQGNQNNFNFDPNFASHPNFQEFMQMMRANPSNFQENSNHFNSTPFFPQQDATQNFNDSQNYPTSQQNLYFEPNLTQPDFEVGRGQGSSNRVQSEEGDNDEDDGNGDTEAIPTTIEPILTPPVVMRSKYKNTGSTPKNPGGNQAWSVREEEAVIACYMEHCTDASIGTNQSAAELWRKVVGSYELARESRPKELPKRNQNSIKNRWIRMSKEVLKWAGYLEEAERTMKSGEVDADVRRQAHIMYKRYEKTNFMFEKAYDLLMKYPKWKFRVNRFLPKRKSEVAKTNESNPDTSGSEKRVRLDEEDDDDIVGGGGLMSGGMVRPDGVKKAKAKKFKGKGTTSCSEVGDMSLSEQLRLSIEMRGVDINLQKEKLEFQKAKERRRLEQYEWEREHIRVQNERLQLEKEQIKAQNMKVKWDMLQSLMTRSNLTQQEEAFKSKLMHEIYEN